MIDSVQEMRQAIAQKCEDIGLACQCSCDGAVNARIAIVAEAPGEREVAMNAPLVGGSGMMLWKSLHKFGIRRTGVYVTNVIKRQLVTEGGDKDNVPAAELQHWEALLRWELTQLPNVDTILILGNPALHALTGERGVNNWRGSVLPISLRHVETFADQMPRIATKEATGIVSLNPAAVLREPRMELVFRMDMDKMRRVMEGTYKPHDIVEHINPTPDQAIDWCHEMASGGLPVAFDIETMGGETACVGFANNAHEGMCINFRDARTNRWPLEDEMRVRYAIQDLLRGDPNIQLVAQNGMFDVTWLWYKDKIRCQPLWFDTMLAHHTLYSQLPHNLGFLTAQYTNHPYYKDDGQTWREGGDIDTFWRYNVKDCCITRAAQLRMQNELAQYKQSEFFFDHVMRLQPHLALMTVGGVRVDRTLKDALAEDLAKEVTKLRDKFNELARIATHQPNLEVNPNSAPQLADLFFRRLRLVGRGSSTDELNRKKMFDHPGTSRAARDLLTTLDLYKKESKFHGTYASMEVDPDGRVRCEYRQTGVQSAPGRLSSSQVMWGSGGNLQNWPERAHEMVEADDGYVYLYFDLSQAEARAVGWLANIETWIEQFEQARLDGVFDCHRALASEMFSIPYDDVPTADREADGTPTLRFISKRCRHGLNYRMQAPRLAETTGLSLARATEAFRLYHRTSPELRDWWAVVEDEARRTRQLVSPKGRILRILERITDEALESIVAFKPQSLVGDHVCEVIYRSHDDPIWPRHSRVALNIHDALIALTRIEDVTQSARVLKQHAEAPIIINGRPMIIPADFGVSVPDATGKCRWSTIKKVKTLDQLSDLVREVRAA